jgi:aminoethylphosphonate catabolism LysR family transcriptional regulator
MNHSHLRAFHLVAKEGSFTRAARAAGLGQPNLSGQVKNLESTYGVRLFERRGRGAELTEIGHRLYAVTDRLFALEDDAEALLAGSKALTVGRLKIGADNALHALPIMAELRRRHRGISLALSVGNSDAVLRELQDYHTDVAVLAKRPSDPRFHVLPYRRDRLIVYVPAAHEWAGRRELRIAELEGREAVMREPGSVTREVIQQALAAAGITLGSVMEIESREAVQAAVAAGFGFGVAFEREFVKDDRFRPIPVADADLQVGEYVACLADRRRLSGVRAFLQIAQAMADTPAGADRG